MARISIIGGGIGGLTVALALREFGFESEVYEQAPALLDVGAAIALWPNALRVLQRLNLRDAILRQAGEIEEIRWLDQHGNLINRAAIPKSVALHRAELQSTLLHALPSHQIKLGHSFVAHRQHNDKVIATFANGHSIEADFLIAADGIHSRVRSQLLGANEPVYRGYTVWRGISPLNLSSLPHATAIEIHGRGQRFGIGPVGHGRVGWWATANASAPNRNHEMQSELLHLFAGWYQPAVQLIEATPSHTILTTTACDREPNPRWGDRRVTTLGDAIHPTTPNLGQGGCLAMEDALVLARCLQKYGPTEEALRKYEGCRHRRTAAITRYSRYYGSSGQWKNPFARGLRKIVLMLTPESVLRRVMQIVFDYDATTVSI